MCHFLDYGTSIFDTCIIQVVACTRSPVLPSRLAGILVKSSFSNVILSPYGSCVWKRKKNDSKINSCESIRSRTLSNLVFLIYHLKDSKGPSKNDISQGVGKSWRPNLGGRGLKLEIFGTILVVWLTGREKGSGLLTSDGDVIFGRPKVRLLW